MRILAVDLGDRRTGLAIGDDALRIASPLDVIEIPRSREPDLLRALSDRARDEGTGRIIVGLPVNMDGSEGPAASGARRFGAALAAASGIEVVFQDERLTSVEADWEMAQSGLTHGQKKARRDALAAAAILRDAFAAMGDRPTE
jgi:putative Holliday junction resolvase